MMGDFMTDASVNRTPTATNGTSEPSHVSETPQHPTTNGAVNGSANGTAHGVNGAPEQNAKPLILVLCTTSSAPGHVLPLCQISRYLVSKGYEVTFVGGVQHRHLIEASGSTFFPVHESITLEKGEFRKWGMQRMQFEEGLPRFRHDFKTFFIGQIPGQFETTKAALVDIGKRAQGREVIIINEGVWFGYLPFKFGAPPVEGFEKMPKTLGINVIPLFLDSVDTPPIPLGLMPDNSPLARERDKVLRSVLYRFVLNESYEGFRNHMKDCGATAVPDDWMMNLAVTAHDTMLQMCDPNVEWPRSDLPKHVKYAGSLPPRPIPREFVYPDWWETDILANAALPADSPDRKRVVVVAQGTLALNYSMLIVPTMVGLASHPRILVVALLGKRGAVIPPEFLPGGVPSNARVSDFIPYDAILPYADVMVCNGGYGGFNHGVVNGVPMIIAGLSEDKLEVAARAAWAGLGINLHTGRPDAPAVVAAVYQILGEPRYRERSRALAEEAAKWDPLAIVERELVALTEGSKTVMPEPVNGKQEPMIVETSVVANGDVPSVTVS
jgi:UDP:flavonoid glycosyltransferase YjiC (YdhE family)